VILSFVELPQAFCILLKNVEDDEVCTGKTGHAESVQIEFDPTVTSYEKILDVFWHTHDPTTLNRQGNDVGTQHRSAIFYHDQKEIADKSKSRCLQKSYCDRNYSYDTHLCIHRYS
jgi:methionine-S-sulfoxide reductase